MRRVLLPALLALLLSAAPAGAVDRGPDAIVAVGDSYISGEAGRWAGNSTSTTPGNDGTDRACQPAGPACMVDTSRVYVGGTDANGCHRSDVAEINSAAIAGLLPINLACSGAVTTNLVPAEGGGEGQGGELPQGDQLAAVARTHDVRGVVVSVGGNDVGFASIIAACLQAYTARTGPCKPSQQAKLDANIPAARGRVVDVVGAIRAVMRGAGYADGDYRLILQTYPSVAPRAAEHRYGEDDPRRSSDGCATYDVDADWARDEASAQIGNMVEAAAQATGTELLDLGDLFQGHEVCAKTAAPATPTARPDAAGSEWGRFVGASTVQQGQLQEAFHPNAFGQLALGRCLAGTWAAPPGRFACAGAAGLAPGDVRLTQTAVSTGGGVPPGGAPAVQRKRRLVVRVRRVRRAAPRACLRVSVRSARAPVRRALVRFGGTRRRTHRGGRVVVCARSARGTSRVLVRKAGFRAVRVRVTRRR